MEISTSSQNELFVAQDNYFEQFINFIDASPNTVRTYRTSLRQWFLYTKEHEIITPTANDVRQYRDQLLAKGLRPTTVQSYLMAVKQFFKWTEEAGFYKDIAKNVIQ